MGRKTQSRKRKLREREDLLGARLSVDAAAAVRTLPVRETWLVTVRVEVPAGLGPFKAADMVHDALERSLSDLCAVRGVSIKPLPDGIL